MPLYPEIACKCGRNLYAPNTSRKKKKKASSSNPRCLLIAIGRRRREVLHQASFWVAVERDCGVILGYPGWTVPSEQKVIDILHAQKPSFGLPSSARDQVGIKSDSRRVIYERMDIPNHPTFFCDSGTTIAGSFRG